MKIFAHIISEMNNRRSLCAAAFAIVAGLLALSWLEGRESAIMRAAQPESTLCVRTNIGGGKIITAADIVIKKIPAKFREPDALSDVNAIVGKMSIGAIPAGSQLTESRISSIEGLDASRALVPLGMRAVVIQSQKQNAYSKLFRAGDVVDVVGITGGDGKNGAAEVLAERAIVISGAGTRSKQQSSLGEFTSSRAESSQPIVVAVRDVDGLRINAAMSRGEVFLNLSSEL